MAIQAGRCENQQALTLCIAAIIGQNLMLPYNWFEYRANLISEKHRAFIALVIKFYYRWALSYTLNTSYYTAFYKHPHLPLSVKLREDSFFRFFKAVLKLGSLSY